MQNTWNQIELGDKKYFDLIVGGTPSKAEENYWNKGTINWVRSADLTKKYLYESEKKITKQGLENSAAKLLPKGTVIISSRVSLGNCAIAGEEMATSQDCTGIVIKSDSIYNEFLYYYMQKHANRIIKMSEGSTIKGITQENLGKMYFQFPIISEQHKIAEILSTVDFAIELAEEKIQKAEQLKRGLMQTLLTRGIGHKKFSISLLLIAG